MKLALALTCTLALIAPSQAQTVQRQVQVYRCGPDGRDLRDAPCPGGPAASTIHYDDPSPADRVAARERARADAREAEALARARRASDAEARQQRAVILGPTRAQPPASASTPPPPPPKPPRLARAHKPAPPPRSASAAAAGR